MNSVGYFVLKPSIDPPKASFIIRRDSKVMSFARTGAYIRGIGSTVSKKKWGLQRK